jgi:hypothetical protein
VSARARVRWSAPGLILGLLLCAGQAGAQTLLDYITFDGIDYIRWAEEPGRALTRADLGSEFAVIECSFGETLVGCPYGSDAGAAFLPTGTVIHAVRGHPTHFRLAAVWQDRIFLYQVWRNPRAKTGGALYALAGKVTTVDVQRGEPPRGTAGAPATIAAPADVAALVEMVVRGTMRRPLPQPAGAPRYWLTFWLTDGTTLGRPYYPESGELMGGLVLPAEFRAMVERALPD